MTNNRVTLLTDLKVRFKYDARKFGKNNLFIIIQFTDSDLVLAV